MKPIAIISSILFVSFLSAQDFSGGFYLGLSPNAGFAHKSVTGAEHQVNPGPSPGFALNTGYSFLFKTLNLVVTPVLNIGFYGYRYIYSEGSGSSRTGGLFPGVRIGWQKVLNERNTLNVALMYQQFPVPFESRTVFTFTDRNTHDTIATIETNTKRYFQTLGLGFGNLFKLKKRYLYLGVAYQYGLNVFSTTGYERYTPGKNYYSEIASRNTHLSIELFLYLRKHNRKTETKG